MQILPVHLMLSLVLWRTRDEVQPCRGQRSGPSRDRSVASSDQAAVRGRSTGTADRAQPPELPGGQTRPARERTREVSLIGVSEVERDLDDLAARIVEHPLRNRVADLRDEPGKRHTLG
jgi:hypothetical protein